MRRRYGGARWNGIRRGVVEKADRRRDHSVRTDGGIMRNTATGQKQRAADKEACD